MGRYGQKWPKSGFHALGQKSMCPPLWMGFECVFRWKLPQLTTYPKSGGPKSSTSDISRFLCFDPVLAVVAWNALQVPTPPIILGQKNSKMVNFVKYKLHGSLEGQNRSLFHQNRMFFGCLVKSLDFIAKKWPILVKFDQSGLLNTQLRGIWWNLPFGIFFGPKWWVELAFVGPFSQRLTKCGKSPKITIPGLYSILILQIFDMLSIEVICT